MGLLGNKIDWLITLGGNLFTFGLVAFIVIQLLIQFEIVPRHNQPARQVWNGLARVYLPILTPLRRILPSISGIDLSPLALIIGVSILQSALIKWL